MSECRRCGDKYTDGRGRCSPAAVLRSATRCRRRPAQNLLGDFLSGGQRVCLFYGLLYEYATLKNHGNPGAADEIHRRPRRGPHRGGGCSAGRTSGPLQFSRAGRADGFMVRARFFSATAAKIFRERRETRGRRTAARGGRRAGGYSQG